MSDNGDPNSLAGDFNTQNVKSQRLEGVDPNSGVTRRQDAEFRQAIQAIDDKLRYEDLDPAVRHVFELQQQTAQHFQTASTIYAAPGSVTARGGEFVPIPRGPPLERSEQVDPTPRAPTDDMLKTPRKDRQYSFASLGDRLSDDTTGITEVPESRFSTRTTDSPPVFSVGDIETQRQTANDEWERESGSLSEDALAMYEKIVSDRALLIREARQRELEQKAEIAGQRRPLSTVESSNANSSTGTFKSAVSKHTVNYGMVDWDGKPISRNDDTQTI